VSAVKLEKATTVDTRGFVAQGNHRSILGATDLLEHIHDVLTIKIEKIDDEEIRYPADGFTVYDVEAQSSGDQTDGVSHGFHNHLIVNDHRYDVGDDFMSFALEGFGDSADRGIVGVKDCDSSHGYTSGFVIPKNTSEMRCFFVIQTSLMPVTLLDFPQL
jgi:hypothetical protein